MRVGFTPENRRPADIIVYLEPQFWTIFGIRGHWSTNRLYWAAMSLCRQIRATSVYEELPVCPRGPSEKDQIYDCDLCGKTFEGQPAGSGLLLWTRGTEMRIEEPPLCERCAARVTGNALYQWAIDDDE